jgi:hypothetical protein
MESRVLMSAAPSWLAPNSQATWDAPTHALTVTGPARIIADPGVDAPVITANGAAAQISVQAASTDQFIHIGGLTLTNGAGMAVVGNLVDPGVGKIALEADPTTGKAYIVGHDAKLISYEIDSVSGKLTNTTVHNAPTGFNTLSTQATAGIVGSPMGASEPFWNVISQATGTYVAEGATLGQTPPYDTIGGGLQAFDLNVGGKSAWTAGTPISDLKFLYGNGTTTLTPAVIDLNATRTHSHHTVLVLGTNGGAAPTFSVDSINGSKLDMTSSDLIVHSGSLSNVKAFAASGRNVAPGGFLDGTWTGAGLTSASAASADAKAGLEQNILAVQRNGDLPLGAFASWTVGTSSETLANADILVKYTYNGDLTLEGQVSDNAAGVFGIFYDGGATSNHQFGEGDLNGDGKVDDTDAAAFGLLFGLGTGGANGPLL